MTLQPQTTRQSRCLHSRISASGSNDVQERRTCADCRLCLGMMHYGKAPDDFILQILRHVRECRPHLWQLAEATPLPHQQEDTSQPPPPPQYPRWVRGGGQQTPSPYVQQQPTSGPSYTDGPTNYSTTSMPQPTVSINRAEPSVPQVVVNVMAQGGQELQQEPHPEDQGRSSMTPQPAATTSRASPMPPSRRSRVL